MIEGHFALEKSVDYSRMIHFHFYLRRDRFTLSKRTDKSDTKLSLDEIV